PPSAEPTYSPSTEPSYAPSAQPSCEPTYTPTPNPSLSPTFLPTPTPGNPTLAPSRRPSARPTREPTRQPTVGPSPQTTPIVSFSSKLTLGGSTDRTLNAAGQASVLNATAESMGIPLDSVTYVGDTAVAENRRLEGLDEHEHNLRRLTTSWTVIATTKVEIPLGSTEYANATELYDSLVSMLDTAVSSGAFTTQLVKAATSLGATSLASVNVTSVFSGAVSVDNTLHTEGDKSDNLLTGGEIAGITIGCAVFVALCCAALFYFFFMGERNTAKVVGLAYNAHPDAEIAL
ncbi:hypothetical protein B484DRAFT_430848, partial [Ochromonadaceae sp. CCMP2298]